MDHGDFDSVSWRNDTSDSDPSRPATATSSDEGRSSPDLNFEPTYGQNLTLRPDETQAGQNADPVDVAGLGAGGGVLEVLVGEPLKENDGTKDAYISYLVTTNVSVKGS